MDVAEEFFKKGILLSPGLKGKIKPEEMEEIIAKFDKRKTVLTEEDYCLIKGGEVRVLEEYKKGQEIKRITNFVSFYNKRFEFLREILEEKLEAEKVTSINKLNYGEATLIGMVRNKKENGFALEDSTGSVFCLSDEKVLEDEVLAVKGKFDKKEFCVEKTFYPDIPLNKKVNVTESDCFVHFTKKLSQKPSRVSYIFTFEVEPEILEGLGSWVITKRGVKGQRRLGVSLPSLVEIGGIKIFVFEAEYLEEIKKKLEMEDEKRLIVSLLKRRHLLPFVYMDNDPYLLREIPDIIFFTGWKESFFLNYKGVSVVSVSGDKGFMVNLKTREFEENA